MATLEEFNEKEISDFPFKPTFKRCFEKMLQADGILTVSAPVETVRISGKDVQVQITLQTDKDEFLSGLEFEVLLGKK